MTFSPVDVLGHPLRPEADLVLHHEHLFCDATCWLEPSDDPATEKAVADADLNDVRRRPWSYADNLRLGEELVRSEAALIPTKAPVMIDVTPVDIGRSPQNLRDLAQTSAVQVFMGCGHYVESARRGESQRAPAFYRDEILSDLFEGVDGIHAAVIGEIGASNPITPLEQASLRGAAQAQTASGAPLLIHIDGWNPNAIEVLDLIESEGADPTRTLICHLDWCLRTHGVEYLVRVLERGVLIAFDTWGDELNYGGNQQPTDDERIDALLELAEKGYGDKILHSNDISTKTQMSRYGGPGYHHIPKIVFPKLSARGLAAADIERLFLAPAVRLLSRHESANFS